MPTLNLGRVRFNWRGDYDALTSYLTYDVVKADGQSYVCIADVTGTGPLDTGGSTYWEGVLLRGADYNAARDEAVAAASAASTSETNAAGSASAASSSETSAAASEALAGDWANEAENVEVASGLFSSYHWAMKAQNFGDPNEFDLTADQTADTRKAREWMAAILANQQAANDAQQAASDALSRANHTGTQPLSTISDAGTAAAKSTGTADAELPTVQQIRDTFDIHVPDPLRRSVEAATSGLCTVERTPNGQPSFMYVVPKHRWEELLPGQELGTGVHEAFLEGATEKSELLVGMYMAAEVGGELVSQPRAVGRRSIDWDASVAGAKAVNMELFGNWEWSAIALWCMANGWQPRGNTDYGVSHSHPHERGVYDGDGSGVEYTLLGSGPNTWNHNNAANGIADLVGNRWERVWGFKMVDGRIFLAPSNDRSLAETSWVDTGWDMPSNRTWASMSNTGAGQDVKRALIVPNGVSDPDGYLYTNLTGERFPFRGGTRGSAGIAGLGALDLNYARSTSSTTLGLRLSRLL